MKPALKRAISYQENSDSENNHTGKKSKKSRVQSPEEALDSELEDLENLEEDEDIEISEEEADLTSSNRNRLRELNQINFDNMRVSEAGTIARVEMVNFMCHKYLKIDLGPKINFIIGHNGSGKSAILTAITIALGASASSTNRGKNLSSFIKEGASAASITIHLTNGGDAPYRPDLYPDMIVIERKINKDGPSPYKLKNLSGQIKSQKKEDLIAILDHMNLMVNNPLTILTQDMARKFLSDSTSEDKYRLFMHGTQLTQLQNDFKGIRESLDTARSILDRKKQGLPALQAKANEAQKRYEDSEKAKKIEDKIDDLNNELVWSQIIAKEKEADKNKTEADSIKRKLDQIKEAYDNKKKSIEAIDESIDKVTEDFEVYKQSCASTDEERGKLVKDKADKNFKINSIEDDMGKIKQSIKKQKQEKQKLIDELKAEKSKLESNNSERKTEIERRIERYKKEQEEKEIEVKKLNLEEKDLEKKISDVDLEKHKLLKKKQSVEQEKNKTVNLTRNLENQKGNHMAAYGVRMPDVLKAIEKETRWEKRKPVGPFGSTLQLLKSQFANTLESVLNKQMNAFAVESFNDKTLLFNILSKFNMKNIPIIVAPYELFDYSSGEPDSKYLTCLRAIKFNDEWVKRQLIISSKIESMLLMESRVEADQLMMNKPKNISFCFTSEGHRVGGKAGMKTEAIEVYRGPPRFLKDIDSAIAKNKKYELELETELRSLYNQTRELEQRLTDLKKRRATCHNTTRQIDREVRSIKEKINEDEETLKGEETVDLSVIQDEIKECDDQLKKLVVQFVDLKTQHDLVDKEVRQIDEQIAAYDKKNESHREVTKDFHGRLETLEKMKSDLNANIESLNTEKQTTDLRYQSKLTAYHESVKLVKEWTEQAQEDYPNRVETERSPREIEKEIAYQQALVDKMAETMGISAEELQRETYAVLKQWNDADSVVKGMEKLSRSLKKMLAKRITKWEVFRQYISISATHYFSYYLHMRGDEGKLRFNHETKKLDIRVSTGDQYVKGSRQKDSRSLSGGEKSFSQISFLLSLWQSISSPVICLDEFDVFMDAINRKQTMKMIMNAASENSSQYILITPQDASNMEPGPYVSVHRLADPDRT